jgi:hypothetical protein
VARRQRLTFYFQVNLSGEMAERFLERQADVGVRE